jgi:hypothetical protein
MSPSDSGRKRFGREIIDAPAANAARNDKLRTNGLRRRARAVHLELRHSDYGFSLLDADGKRVDGRNDLTLNEVEKLLEAAGAPRAPVRTRR